jgi:uncharacterized protein
MTRKALFLFLVFALTVISDSAVSQRRLIIASGGTAGIYHPLGAAAAKVLNAHVPDVSASNEATSASADNIRMVVAGKADIAFSQADTAWDAYKGRGVFQAEGVQPIRTVLVLYPNSLQVVVRADSGIAKVGDLRGKRVSTGAQGSGTEIWAYRFLQASGIDPATQITDHKLLVGPSAAEMKAGKIDAFIWSGGIPTKAINDLALDPSVKIRLLNTAAAVPDMLRRYGPVYTDGEVPVNTYSGIGNAIPVAQVWNVLVVRADTDEQLIYRITKTLFERKADLVAGHIAAKDMEMAIQARGGSPIPFHPGAIRYMRERGVRILR